MDPLQVIRGMWSSHGWGSKGGQLRGRACWCGIVGWVGRRLVFRRRREVDWRGVVGIVVGQWCGRGGWWMLAQQLPAFGLWISNVLSSDPEPVGRGGSWADMEERRLWRRGGGVVEGRFGEGHRGEDRRTCRQGC